MGRIKLDIAGKFLTRISVSVRVTDINYGNHVGNDAMVSILHEARATWLHQRKFTELDIHGTGLILSELVVNFKRESVYGDILDIDLYAADVNKKSFELFYSVNTNRNSIQTEIAVAKTTMISYDYTKKKVIEMPTQLAALLS